MASCGWGRIDKRQPKIPSLSLENLFISIHTPSGYGEPTQRLKEFIQMVLILNPYLSLVSLQQLVVCFWLEDNCFTTATTWISHKYITHISPPSWISSNPCPHPTTLGHHRELGPRLLCYRSSPLPICFTYGNVCISMPLSRICPTLSFPRCVCKSILYICISFPAWR